VKNLPLDLECPVQYALNVFGGKWKVLIIHQLQDQTLRFSELKRAISGVTQKMLTSQLRELENDELVKRVVYPQVPPKVEYSLTPFGKTLIPVMDCLCQWGETYKNHKLQTARAEVTI
jgi:DNA-binding HxlR family transcriptional regulator